jgi:sulfate adenylyltransferase
MRPSADDDSVWKAEQSDFDRLVGTFTALDAASQLTSIDVLFVCHANLCRSPIAAAAFRRHDPFGLQVASRGLIRRTGSPSAATLKAARLFDLDLDDHGPKRLSDSEAAIAKLILTMEASQRVSIIHEHPDDWRKVFTLGEFAAAAARVAGKSSDGFAVTRAVVEQARPLQAALSLRSDLDVVDPSGRGQRAHVTAAREIVGHVSTICKAFGASQHSLAGDRARESVSVADIRSGITYE